MIRAYFKLWHDTWNGFWFVPMAADTLALMRILVGSMLVYTHLAWTLELQTFFDATGTAAVPTGYRGMFPHTASVNFVWSHFDFGSSFAWRWGSHLVGLIIFCAFMAGWWTRGTSILSFLLVVSYANRASGALFGLDQVNAFLTLYLSISGCGSRWSMDHFFKMRRGLPINDYLSVRNTIATRLIQLHLCIVYLFAGLGKLQGNLWWNGEAIWGALASYEYQTLDLTFLCHWMWLVNLLTYVTVAWEIAYPFLIWSKLTRPIFLIVAVAVHLGIGLAMGMLTFGLIMIYANVSFIPSQTVQRLQRLGADNKERSGLSSPTRQETST